MQILDSRGSGEVGISEPGEAFQKALKHELGGFPVAVRTNQYPAVSIVGTVNQIKRATLGLAPTQLLSAIADSLNGVGANLPSWLHVGRYHDSVKQGRRELRKLLKEVRSRCGQASHLILVGYSQGAQVSADVWQGLKQKDRASIAGVVLFGDPKYLRTSFAAQQSRKHNGILHARNEFSSGKGKVLSYCHGRDMICQTYGTAGPHRTYGTAGDAKDAAKKIAARIDFSKSPAFEIAAAPVPANGFRPSVRVGALRANPSRERGYSLAGFDDAFGGGDHCTVADYPSWVRAHWDLFGLSGEYMTYGAFADKNGNYDPNGTGCTYRGQIFVDSLVATGPFWHTAAGLRVGDPEGRIAALYPGATFHQDYYGTGWWLGTQTFPWGDPSLPAPTVLATVTGGRVSALKLVIIAQGD